MTTNNENTLVTEFKDKKLDHLFKARPKHFNCANRPPVKDLSRVVKWPKYVVTQRKKAILKKRLKIPPPVFQFSITLPKDITKNLTALLKRYPPETRQEKRKRMLEIAQRLLDAEKNGTPTENIQKEGPKPFFVKSGLKHVTRLIETKRAKLVVIAADVEPLELVLFLPTLCRKMDIPYCIVSSKAFLGSFVNRKTTTCLALTEVAKGRDEIALAELIKFAYDSYNKTEFKKWGGGELGFKAKAKAIKAGKKLLG